MRRRRRRGQGLSRQGWMVILGGAGVLLIGGFIALLSAANYAEPTQSERRIELPNAIKD